MTGVQTFEKESTLEGVRTLNLCGDEYLENFGK
jgi:hypothetical protein